MVTRIPCGRRPPASRHRDALPARRPHVVAPHLRPLVPVAPPEKQAETQRTRRTRGGSWLETRPSDARVSSQKPPRRLRVPASPPVQSAPAATRGRSSTASTLGFEVLDPPAVQRDPHVARSAREDLVVRDHHHDGAARSLVLQNLAERLDALRVEPGRRLVEEEELRRMYERAGQGDPLALPARIGPERPLGERPELEARARRLEGRMRAADRAAAPRARCSRDRSGRRSRANRGRPSRARCAPARACDRASRGRPCPRSGASASRRWRGASTYPSRSVRRPWTPDLPRTRP